MNNKKFCKIGGNPLVMGVNPMMMSGNPMLMGVNPMMMGVNPMMMGGNPMMMGGNPILMGGNPMLMGGNPMMMGVGKGIKQLDGGINMKVMISELKKKYKQKQMANGYHFGKLMALLIKQMKDKQSTTNLPTNKNRINSQSNTNSKITVNFQKGGETTKFEMETTSAVFELIYEFCEKTNTNSGTFKFGNQTLSPCDSRNLSEAGLKNGDTIIVS